MCKMGQSLNIITALLPMCILTVLVCVCVCISVCVRETSCDEFVSEKAKRACA